MSDIECRNRLEAEFESLIARYICPSITTDIDRVSSPTDAVTIEQIVDFYVRNEVEIDNEGMIRAFVTSIHFATDADSAKLSKWLIAVRPVLIESIKPDMVVKILSKKLSNLLDTSELEFITTYIQWILVTYCANHTSRENQYVLSKYLYRVNRKLMVVATRTGAGIAVTERDKKLTAYFLSNNTFLSKLYDEQI